MVFFILEHYYIIPGYTCAIVLLYFYYLSEKILELKNNNWYKYHFMFHFITTCGQIIIIDSILKNQHLK